MKNLSKIIKIATAILAVAAVVYVVVAYGDKIAAWVKRRLGRGTCEYDYECDDDCENCDCTCEDCECQCEDHAAEEDDFQN